MAEHVNRHIGIHYSQSKFVQLYNKNNANKNQHNRTIDGDSNDGRRGNRQTCTNIPSQSENITPSSNPNERNSRNRESTGMNSGNSCTDSHNCRSNQSNSRGCGLRGNFNNYNSNRREYHRNADDSTNWRGIYRGNYVNDTNHGSFVGGRSRPYCRNRSQQSGNSGSPDPNQTGNQANLVCGDPGTVVVPGPQENSAEVESQESASVAVVINNNTCSALYESSANLMTCYGQINGQPARIVLDTGASGLFVNKKFLKSQALGPKHNVSCTFADSHECHSAVVELDCPISKVLHPRLYRSFHFKMLCWGAYLELSLSQVALRIGNSMTLLER